MYSFLEYMCELIYYYISRSVFFLGIDAFVEFLLIGHSVFFIGIGVG